MKQKSRFIDAYRQHLEQHQLYHHRNEPLIENHGRNDWLIAEMEESLRKTTFILRQTGSMGQTKIQMHPFIEQIRKLNGQNAYIDSVLGLGNKQDVEIAKESELEQFMNEIENYE